MRLLTHDDLVLADDLVRAARRRAAAGFWLLRSLFSRAPFCWGGAFPSLRAHPSPAAAAATFVPTLTPHLRGERGLRRERTGVPPAFGGTSGSGRDRRPGSGARRVGPSARRGAAMPITKPGMPRGPGSSRIAALPRDAGGSGGRLTCEAGGRRRLPIIARSPSRPR
jgi:hypothetical protein